MRNGKCLDRLLRIRAVEREYQVASLAQEILKDALERDPSRLTRQGLQQVDFDAMTENLDLTYLIRIFAEFETGLLDYWKVGLNKIKPTRVSDLINAIGSSRKMRGQEQENAHLVRKYRNKLIHEENAEASIVSIIDARKFLCRFFSLLPPDW